MKTILTVEVSFVDDFIRFLNQQNASAAYRAEAAKTLKSPEYVYSVLKETSPWEWISSPFVWSESDFGTDFWNKLDLYWKQFLLKGKGNVKANDVRYEVVLSQEEVVWWYRESILGRLYRVGDLSYNRPVMPEYENYEWSLVDSVLGDDTHTKYLLKDTGESYLVLSDCPEMKKMNWHGPDATPRPMIKVWVPELNHAQWVFFQEGNLQPQITETR